MKYRIEFETEDHKHAANILRELAQIAVKGEPDGGDVHSKEFGIILGEWSFETSSDES